MKSLTLSRMAAAFIFVAVVGALGHLFATTVIAFDANDLVLRSDRIVHATCSDCQTYRDSRGRIVTRYTFEVEETLRGTHTDRIHLIQPGGEYRGVTLLIPGLSPHHDGDEVVLFLGPKAGPGGEWRLPVGLDQGVYRVVEHEQTGVKTVRRTLAALHRIPKPGEKGSLPSFPEEVDPEEFKDAVRARVKELEE